MRLLVALIIQLFSFTVALAQPCALIDITYSQSTKLPECFQADGVITITNTTGGQSPYTFRLDTLRNSTGIFTELETKVYRLIIVDSKGCTDTSFIDLTYDNIGNVIKPYNAFTPNGDNINDRWYIPGIESFGATEVRVFNRWGQLIYNNSEYTNKEGWDGTQNNSKLPASTYYYVISTVNNCVKEYIKGTVSIIR